MSRPLVSTLCCVLCAALLLMIGNACQNMAASAPDVRHPVRAIVISGGNGGSTTVYVEDAPDHVEMLSSPGAKVCAQCRTDAMAYFKTGLLEPKCSECGGMRTPVIWTATPPTSGHN